MRTAAEESMSLQHLIQYSGGRVAGGITISRLPNRRASSEKAPGPSNESDTASTTI